MSASEPQPLLERYVQEMAVGNFLAVFDLADKEEGIFEAFGSMDNLHNILGTELWAELNPEDDPTPEVEYADAQAALLAARMCRVLIDDPELLPHRAAWLERWAADVFARYAPTGADDAS